MSRITFDILLEAGAHFGHLKRKRNPAMSPYIYKEHNGIHLIDLHKTVMQVDKAADALKQIAKSGKDILFVATKKQAQQIVSEKAASVEMPFVIERWPGGMLTNFPTIRKAVRKMETIKTQQVDGTFKNLSKREKLQIERKQAKLEKNLGSIAKMQRIPSALFVVDVLKENIAVREANRLGIPVFGIVDTNSNPKEINFVIPANDDSAKAIEVILGACCEAIAEGRNEYKIERADNANANKDDDAPRRSGLRPKTGKRKVARENEEAVEAVEVAVPAVDAAPAPVVEEVAPVEEKVEAAAKEATKE